MVNPNRSNAAKKQWRDGNIREAVANRNNEAFGTDEHRDLKRSLSLRIWTIEKREALSRKKKE